MGRRTAKTISGRLIRAGLGSVVLGAFLVAPVHAVPVPPSGSDRPYAPGRTAVRAVEFETEITETVGDGLCVVSLWVVVDDVSDASHFTATITRLQLGGTQVTTVFNRHERGLAGGSAAPPAVSEGQVAAHLATTIGFGGPEACPEAQLQLVEDYVVSSVVVTTFTRPRPEPDQAGYHVIGVPIGPANDGPTGKDGCRLHWFLSVPERPGATAYTITVSTRTSGPDSTTSYELALDEFEPTTPDAPNVGDYSVRGRLGHYGGSFTDTSGLGCTYAVQQWLASDRVPSVRQVTFRVAYPRCHGKRPTIVSTGLATEGTTGNDVILGRAGSDVIDGKDGDDIICGRGGADTLVGGRGRDVLDGGAGVDECRGGPGRNRLVSC